MGECILTRSTVIPEEVLTPIYPTEGIHKILATVRSSSGEKLSGISVNCLDTDKWFNYTTNENGQCLFSTNSGQCYFTVTPRFSNNIILIDQKRISSYKVDTPVGETSRINFNFGGYNVGESISFFYSISRYSDEYTSPTQYFINGMNYKFADTKKVDCICGGAGGSGSSGNSSVLGSGGSGGQLIRKNDISINKDAIYIGWVAGTTDPVINNSIGPWSNVYNGYTGGTTTFLGVSAIGGNGGTISSVAVSPNNGYFGNGGYKGNGANSNVNWGGGGGAANYHDTAGTTGNGGWPGGGHGGWRGTYAYRAKSGTMGGGGGGGYGLGWVEDSNGNTVYNYHRGGYGGSGKLEIIIKEK